MRSFQREVSYASFKNHPSLVIRLGEKTLTGIDRTRVNAGIKKTW